MKKLLCLLALSYASGFVFAADTAGPTLAQGNARLLRQPTYFKGKIAFSYLGDIWIASENGSDLRRLTDHTAREVMPRFSPDGKFIAFSSNRDGNHDIYVVPAEGGKPRQLTYQSAEDMLVGWKPDGRRILFASSRNKGVFPSVTTLFEIPIDGGMEEPIQTDWGSFASYSPDAAKLAFTRHPGSWSRKHYRGSYAADLWIMNIAEKKFTRLGEQDYKGNYLWPMYGKNGFIYFVADRLPEEQEKYVKFGGQEVMKSVNNIWKISERGGKATQVTHHTSGNLFFPSISADGKTIVYEENFGLWKLDVGSGKSSEIHLHITSDVKDNEVMLRTISSEAESFGLSPSTKRAAISTHGEIFTVATDRGEVQRVTESFWREQAPRWSPDGKLIAFTSDKDGSEEVWVADERGRNPKKLTAVDCEKFALQWAPDSKSLLWSGSDHKLRRVFVEDGKTDVLAGSENGPVSTPQFSPDGKWISYTKQDKILRSHVYVQELKSGEEHMIGAEDFLLSTGAKWTPDGKKLLLLGGVGAAGMASLNRTTLQLYSVALTHIDKNPDDRDVDTEEQAQLAQTPARRPRSANTTNRITSDEEVDAPKRNSEAVASTKPEVKIEWDGLDRRIKKLTQVGGSVSTVTPSPDSRTYAFVASGGAEEGESSRPALYAIGDDGSRLTTLAQGSPPDPADEAPRGRGGFGGFGEPQWSRDGRSVYYMQGGGIYSVAAPAAPAGDASGASTGSRTGGSRTGRGTVASASEPSATPRRVSFTVRLEIDETAERRQVFEEAWRVMKHRFYDAKMHGVDWAAMKSRYEPLLGNIADNEELHTLLMQMIGELNASHTGVSGGSSGTGGSDRVATRYPGFEMEPDASGYYKITYIYKKGPADHDYVNLSVGNYVLAVTGKPLKSGDNYWKLFNLVHGRKFEFTLNSEPK
ncbi:MAG TPA: hypothetical protein VMZ27_12655, partial [Candidatus Saccharimonadales bacterium]|nr:hypothetical protein [Candidatus Saccharimonadales bacterium]